MGLDSSLANGKRNRAAAITRGGAWRRYSAVVGAIRSP
jgi:hypothetical protein